MTECLDRWRQRAAVSPDRLPPGQVETTKRPVLHYGTVPQIDRRSGTFDVAGLVERPFTLSHDELLALPRETRCDLAPRHPPVPVPLFLPAGAATRWLPGAFACPS